MKILKQGVLSYPQDPTRYFNFEKFSTTNSDFYLIEGFIDFDILHKFKHKKLVYMEFEDPNRFGVKDPKFNHFEYDQLFYKVITICPYTAEWLNRRYQCDKYISAFFPFNTEYLPQLKKKKYDVIYTGHINSPEIENNIKELTSCKYRFVSNSDSDLVTDKSATYTQKLNLIAESKITLVHNLLFITKEQANNIRGIEGYGENYAFHNITNSLGNKMRNVFLAPHLKSRTFEAAFSQSLILCRRDQFNIIERYFEPNKEFIYYEKGQLSSTIKKILEKYEEYLPIIDRAYKKAMRCYSTETYYNKYLRDIQ